MSRVARRPVTSVLSGLLLLLIVAAPLASAQDQAATFAERLDGQHISDDARVLDDEVEQSIEEDLRAHLAETGVDLVIYIQQKRRVGARKGANDDAAALLDAWGVGGDDGLGAVMLWNVNAARDSTKLGVAVADGTRALVDTRTLDGRVFEAVQGSLNTGEFVLAASDGVVTLKAGTTPDGASSATPQPSDAARPASPRPTRTPRSTVSRPSLGAAPPAGPPYPDPIDGIRVYDWAGILDEATVAELEDDIATIEARTGAQVVVYSQFKPASDSPAKAEADAVALIDEWGIGRRGFDDGLVILFDLSDACHGQVQLYAAPGYAAAFLTNQERQAIFEDDMLPALRECDFDTAMLAAMERVDEAATAEHANDLQLARQVDAAAGLVLAPLLLIGLVGWAGWSWLRYGRDPEYLDDPSILMAAPPPGMSPAAAVVVMDGRSRRRALTTALVELAARGEISFRQSEDDKAALDVDLTVPDQRDARLARNRRLPLGAAEAYALSQLRELGGTRRTIAADDLAKFSRAVAGFDDRIEQLVADRGWYREPPEESISRWSLRSGLVLIVGVVATFFGINLPSNGLLLVGVALLVAAACIFVIARVMPQRTMEGARMFAQLAAYRRTLQKTLEQARTIDQVVSSGVLPWVETPDQAVVWSYALGLHEEAEEVLERSLEDVRTGSASPTRTYFPLWFAIGPRTGARTSSAAKAPTAGLFSGGVVPDFTSMTAALSTIGSPPASSGGGSGGGGFSGGSSGGGGGGAGGGF